MLDEDVVKPILAPLKFVTKYFMTEPSRSRDKLRKIGDNAVIECALRPTDVLNFAQNVTSRSSPEVRYFS